MTPAFVIGAAVLALLVTMALVWPLLRRVRTAAARRDYDLTIYRDQLAEIERDRRRGVLNDPEAEAARLEVQRRLLVADRRATSSATDRSAETVDGRRDWFLPATLALLVPGLSLGFYLMLGRPDLPSVDFAQQQAAVSDMTGLAEQLRERLQVQPENAQGWELLGRTYLQLGKPAEAAEAFRSALGYGGEPARLNSSLGEALVAAGQGEVGQEARAAFARALEADPADPRARYYAGLALVQDGRGRQGLAVWRSLAEASPPDAPWLPTLNRSIAQLAADLGEAPETAGGQAPSAAAPGPTQQDIEAAREMSEGERMAFIRSMVERLATRLEEEPGDVDGWLRLARARQVLGERDQAIAALRSAQAALGEQAADAALRQRVEEALKALGEVP